MTKHLCLLLCFIVVGCQGGAAPSPLYIGHVATTSGPWAAAGERETWGIRLAVQQLADDKFQIMGRPLHVKHTDARGQLDALQGEAVRLVAVSRVLALYGGESADEVLRLDRASVPMVTPLGFRPAGASDLVFCTGIAPAQQGLALARFAALEKKVRHVAVFVDERREDAREVADAFEKEFAKAAAEKQAKDEELRVNVTTFGKDAPLAALAEFVEGTKIQAVLFAGTAGDFAEFRGSLPANVAVYFGGPDGELRLTGKGNDGVYAASAFAVDKELPQTEAFAQKFREAYKEAPDVHAALAYDGVRLLADAMRRAEVPVGERLLVELKKTKDFAGLTGPVSFGKDQVLRRPVFVGTIAGSEFKAVKRYEGAER